MEIFVIIKKLFEKFSQFQKTKPTIFKYIKSVIYMKKTMKFDIILEKQEEGGYTAYVPSLPGCISEGETEKDALKNIKEAIEIYTEEINKTKLKNLVSSISIKQMQVSVNV
jgi:predicted RNase H-like HicB family nuclease